MVSRRNFIRSIGAGTVVLGAAGVGLTQCDPMPDTAIEAWRGPSAGVRDPRIRAISYAILAPNPHNMQAWLVDLRTPDSVVLHVDRTRLLPMTDPFSRQVVIGQGTFLELLAMAAAEQGFRTVATLFPEGEFPPNSISSAPIAKVSFVHDDRVERDPLFSQILKRHTTRSEYADKPLTPSHLTELEAAHTTPDVSLTVVDDPATLSRLRAIAAGAFEVEMSTYRTLKESVDRMRVGGADIAAHRDGLFLHGPLYWWAKILGLLTPSAALTPGSFAATSTIELGKSWAGSGAAFGVLTTPDNSRRSQITAGRAYVRAHLAATKLGIAQHPMSQALQEYPEVQQLQRELLAALGTPSGHTVQMFYRLGYATIGERAPRRPVSDLILG